QVFDGTTEWLVAVRQLMQARDRRAELRGFPAPVPDAVRQRWRDRLADPASLTASEAAELLQDYGIPAARSVAAGNVEDAVRAAQAVGWPVAMKSAVPGLAHKSDAGGVLLDLRDEAALREGHARLARLGPQVTVSPMVRGRIELAFGMVQDPQFGPMLLL